MTPDLRYALVLLLLIVAAMFSSAVRAHDIGVSPAELAEKEGYDYVLRVRAGTGATLMFPSPGLPGHCDFIGNPRGVQAPGWWIWEFGCEKRLTANDRLDLPWRRDGIVLTANWLDGSEIKRLFNSKAGTITVPLAELQAGSGSWIAGAKRYTALGIEHILLGIDHLLFVLALLLIVRGAWMLVKTITAFTVAHSITLGLATLGFVQVPPAPVEAAIALSIVFLCVEIIHAHQGREGITYRYPWVVAFTFGLLHGFGFAGALSNIGLPQAEIPLALAFFNIGVEIGQLIFVGVVLLAAWFVSRLPRHSWLVERAIPAYTIGSLATYWFFQRFGGLLFPA